MYISNTSELFQAVSLGGGQCSMCLRGLCSFLIALATSLLRSPTPDEHELPDRSRVVSKEAQSVAERKDQHESAFSAIAAALPHSATRTASSSPRFFFPLPRSAWPIECRRATLTSSDGVMPGNVSEIATGCAIRAAGILPRQASLLFRQLGQVGIDCRQNLVRKPVGRKLLDGLERHRTSHLHLWVGSKARNVLVQNGTAAGSSSSVPISVSAVE